jgi:hypothetical protein
MPDYKIAALLDVNKSYQNLEPTIRTPELRPVARAFVTSVDRVIQLGMFPIIAVRLYKSALCLSNSIQIQQQVSAKVLEDSKAEILARLRISLCDANGAITLLKEAAEWLDVLVPYTANLLGDPVRSIFENMVLGTWTAFEVMSADVKREIRRSDRLAFWRHHTKAAVEGVTNENALVFLKATRHVIVHRAGKVDREFLKAVRGFAELRDLQPGSVVSLNGDIVKRLIDPAVEASVNLMRSVDERVDGWRAGGVRRL